MKKCQNQALVVLAGIILIRGFASGGVNMTASLYLAPVCRELGVGLGTLSLYFSIMSVVTVLWLPGAGRLINRFPVQVLALAAAAFHSLSFAALGLMDHVAGWYLLCIPQAMGATILISLMGPVLINRWFPHNTGTVMGIQMAFVCLFTAALQPAASWLIESFGWRNAYVMSGLPVFGAVAAAAVLFLRDRPQAAKEERKEEEVAQARRVEEREEGEEEAAQARRKEAGEKGEEEAAQARWKENGDAAGRREAPEALQKQGRPCQEEDRAETEAPESAVAQLQIPEQMAVRSASFALLLAFMTAMTGAAAFLHGAASSSIAVIAPILTLVFYGKQDYEKIFAKVSMGAPLASILLIPAYGFIYDATGGYGPVLVLMLFLLAAAAAGIFWGWKLRCTNPGCPTWRKP